MFRSIDTHDNNPDVCWEWTGSTGGRDGRGYITIDGKKLLSYRVVWELFNGPIPDDMVIRHKVCDNPVCNNPLHLAIGTRGDNEDDKYESDRAGYPHDWIKEMRRVHKLGLSYQKVADHINTKFSATVSRSGVAKVLMGTRRRKQQLTPRE